MVRFICQIISFQLLAAAFLTGCLALAQGPPPRGGPVSGDGREGDGERARIWRLAGWLKPEADLPDGREMRSVAIGDPATGEIFELSMIFPGPMASWPVALKATCREGEGGQRLSLSDIEPFGGDGVRGGEPSALAPCLAFLDSLLSRGQWLERPAFEDIEPGLWLAVLKANYGPRLGPKDVVIVKADMRLFRLAPYHEGESEGWARSPAAVLGWAGRLKDAALIFNAGQYYPDRRHMGLLIREGASLPGSAHKSWRGYVVQGPLEDGQGLPTTPEAQPAGPGWALIDEDTRLPGTPGPEAYSTVIQSYMVLDRLGRIRVRDTDRLASRSALGIDRDRMMWLVIVPGAISLYDLALLLQKLGLVAAVGLDGGLETQARLLAPEGPRIWLGSAANNFLGTFLVQDMSPSLPAGIALERRPGQAAR